MRRLGNIGLNVRIASRHLTDEHHRYLKHVRIEQPDGVDDQYRVKNEQQNWLDREQWAGYSDAYCKKMMSYLPGHEHFFSPIAFPAPELNKCLALVFNAYGAAASILHELHDDPLHPQFHERMTQVVANAKELERGIDEVYAGLHPTVKTVYDAFAVRRYYHLMDWIEHVKAKRHRILTSTPQELLLEIEKVSQLCEMHIARLRQLRDSLADEEHLYLIEGKGFSEEEVAVVRRHARYFRAARLFGENSTYGDTHS